MCFSLVKITDHFVIDKNTLKIYEVILGANKKVKNYMECCTIAFDDSIGDYRVVNRKGAVAIGVIEKAKMVASKIENRQ